MHEIVCQQLIHRPCGEWDRSSVCMKDGKCTKRFHHEFLNETQIGEDGYLSYRCQSPGYGSHVAKAKRRGQEINIDNRFMIPYSPVLCRIFNAKH